MRNATDESQTDLGHFLFVLTSRQNNVNNRIKMVSIVLYRIRA